MLWVRKDLLPFIPVSFTFKVFLQTIYIFMFVCHRARTRFAAAATNRCAARAGTKTGAKKATGGRCPGSASSTCRCVRDSRVPSHSLGGKLKTTQAHFFFQPNSGVSSRSESVLQGHSDQETPMQFFGRKTMTGGGAAVYCGVFSFALLSLTLSHPLSDIRYKCGAAPSQSLRPLRGTPLGAATFCTWCATLRWRRTTRCLAKRGLGSAASTPGAAILRRNVDLTPLSLSLPSLRKLASLYSLPYYSNSTRTTLTPINRCNILTVCRAH